MLISYSHSFIFFHVAKVAGISIRHELLPYTQEPERFNVNRPPKKIKGRLNGFYLMWDSALTHATARQTQRALPEEFSQFYKFAFVRNPWDWQVSMYHFLLKEKENPRYKIVSELGSFKQYLMWVVEEEKPFPKGATKLQKTMLTDSNNKISVDKIGHFENLASDFSDIAATIGIKASLPKLNSSEHGNYTSYYDGYTKKLVERHFAEDIDLFGYTY